MLSERVQPGVDRREDPLVVIDRARAAVGEPRDPSHHAGPDSLEHRHRRVRVAVVAVHRVDVVAQPHARVRRTHGRAAQPEGSSEHRERLAGTPVDRLLEPERRWRRRACAAVKPAVEQMMVVVAGDDHDLDAAAERLPERLENRARHLERIPRRPLAKLDDVPEQHEPVSATSRVEQCRERGLLPQHVPT